MVQIGRKSEAVFKTTKKLAIFNAARFCAACVRDCTSLERWGRTSSSINFDWNLVMPSALAGSPTSKLLMPERINGSCSHCDKLSRRDTTCGIQPYFVSFNANSSSVPLQSIQAPFGLFLAVQDCSSPTHFAHEFSAAVNTKHLANEVFNIIDNFSSLVLLRRSCGQLIG